MPTPISSARQCLAGEAAATLDDAVAVARRRAHAQTTSLHLVYALLSSSSSSPSSILRDALSRARSSMYSPRLQFKALELCFGVALDRLPSSSSSSSSSSSQHHKQAAPAEEPPVSNSLMAAIKRSQANQRRNPDTFHLYQQQQQQQQQGSSSFCGVKVELQQLVLAILDDPIVSRVFGEAGFRSCDIKLAVLRPPLPILRFPRAARCPPLFLCNFSAADDFDALPTPRGFTFPFSASDGGDENCRRIGEVLARRSTRNPMLVGVSAGEAAQDFARAVERQNWAVLPPELRGLRLVSIEREVSELGKSGDGRSRIGARLEEMGRQAEEPGVVLSIGDLKGMVEGGDDVGSCLVPELTRVLELFRGRLWVMGWSASYETYMKFLSRYPLLDKDLDLQLLPITTVRPGTGGSLPRPPSLTDSFVPFGGFFPTAYESKVLLSSPYPSVLRCQHCNDKCKQEVAAILKGHSASAEDQHSADVPALVQRANIFSINGGLDASKAQDDKTLLNVKVMDLQKKWNDYCQRIHQGCLRLETDSYQALGNIVGLPYVSSDKERASNLNSNNPDLTQNQQYQEGCGNSFPMVGGLQKIAAASQSLSLSVIPEPKNKDLISKLQVRQSKSEQLQREIFQSHQGPHSDSGNHDDHTSPSSVTSVRTDLVLGTPHEPTCKDEQHAIQKHTNHLDSCSGSLLSKKVDDFSRNVPEVLVQSHSCSDCPDLLKNGTYPLMYSPSVSKSGGAPAFNQQCLGSSNVCQKFDQSNYKSFCASLIDKVGRQEEALSAISQTIVHCRAGHERYRGASLKGDVWLSFLGPDSVGKKKVAVALAELIYGSKENLISIDLSYQNGITFPITICDQQEVSGYDTRFRGKTNVDHIAGELSKKPWSIVFLQNVDKADLRVQSSLSQAILTGKFPDSHGREFGISNTIFVMTAMKAQGKVFSRMTDSVKFPEERILAARSWQMKILTQPVSEAASCNPNVNVLIASRQKSRNKQSYLSPVFVSKRKLDVADDLKEQHESLETAKRAHRTSNTFLDLNLPVEEVESNDAESSSSDGNSSTSDNTEAWVEDFFSSVDATMNFKPYDFDALADSILKEISKSFHDTIGSECMLEIDVKVMEQILAAAWLSDDRGALDVWIERVLGRSFIELRERCKLLTQTVVRLVACEDVVMGEHAPGVLLPSRICLN
ncbi:protein DWARF 53-LIKE-like [Phoenix dactylifera]|uniref:Protein DWARF 53-LIKE-like n=1 Tax=Phoenix dactylifera TaxID=42345 RepID=A0A8B7CSG5_PHODC|nr:protein DWARF 53-LIKE-like [Phoenix dactylifera]